MRLNAWLMGALLLAIGFPVSATAQEGEPPMPQPVEQHKISKQDVGTWHAVVKMWMEPGQAEPEVMKGVETNRMLGEFWVVSNFEGEFMGMPFGGISLLGYDVDRKKYHGTWRDTMTPYVMVMDGTYDAATKTMTMVSEGKDMTGQPTRGKTVVTYEGENKRVATMYNKAPGSDEMFKSMEITYTRRK